MFMVVLLETAAKKYCQEREGKKNQYRRARKQLKEKKWLQISTWKGSETCCK